MGKDGRPTVNITGMGVLSGLGEDVLTLWNNVVAGNSCVDFIEEFPREGLNSQIAALVPNPGRFGVVAVDRAAGYIDAAVSQAVAQAGLDDDELARAQFVIGICPFDLTWADRIAIFRQAEVAEDAFSAVSSGVAMPDLLRKYHLDALAAEISRRYGLQSAPLFEHTACSSGNTALQLGAEMIEDGANDIVVAVGCEISSNQEAITRFGLLGTLARYETTPQDAPRPFSLDRSGFVLADGAGAMVLRAGGTHATETIANLAGVGEAVDTFHRTRSDPEAVASKLSLKRTLGNAGLRPDQIGYINAHGTGTFENDKTEAACVVALFDERATTLPVSSSKSMTGHALSAAGMLEAVITVQVLKTGICPPTKNYFNPDPDIPLNVVPHEAQEHKLSAALSNSFGFGGQNVCCAFTNPEVFGIE